MIDVEQRIAEALLGGKVVTDLAQLARDVTAERDEYVTKYEQNAESALRACETAALEIVRLYRELVYRQLEAYTQDVGALMRLIDIAMGPSGGWSTRDCWLLASQLAPDVWVRKEDTT